ncbi:hypothetical protein [Streptomyces cyaneofuscatus]|uniref:hypothetical protein n=1 Tax=Streptomyces cyaneofuscatus TaxID=66883 RepID=UPI0036659D58
MKDTPKLVLRTSVIMLILGLALLAFGLVADAHGWWEGHEFATNVASSATSLCFGVPAALLVFSHLGQAQEEAREKTHARTQVVESTAEFEATLLDPFDAVDLAHLRSELRQLSQSLQSTKDASLDDSAREERITDFLRQLQALLPRVGSQHPYRNLRAAQHDRETWAAMRRWQTRVASQSRILDQEVRPRLVATKSPWLTTSQASDILQATRWLFMEGRNPWKAGPRRDANESVSGAAMKYFLDDVTELCSGVIALKALYPQ